MRRKHVLTKKNRRKLYAGLKKYLNEVLRDEEYTDTMEKLKLDAVRVECYPASPFLSVRKCSEYLRGLPINTEYLTHKIVNLLLSMVNISRVDFDNGFYIEDIYDLDKFYWDCLGSIVYSYRQ